jgi:hypothetical protein
MRPREILGPLLVALALVLACAGWLAPDGCGPITALVTPSTCH